MSDEDSIGLICPCEYPHQFYYGRNRNEAGIFRGERTDESHGLGRLARVVLRNKTHKYICIEADHRAEAPRSAIASFISAIVTGLFRFGRIPLRDCMETVAGI